MSVVKIGYGISVGVEEMSVVETGQREGGEMNGVGELAIGKIGQGN